MAKPTLNYRLWRRTSLQLVPYAILLIVGVVLCDFNGHARNGALDRRALAAIGVLLFITASVQFLRILTATIHKLISTHHLGPGRAGSIQFVMRAVGYVAIALISLQLLGISVERLLVGGAVLGIILGVAAQQALGNFFASIVLVISHPFSVGQRISFNAGSLGGRYDGVITDIGLTHTRLRLDDGTMVMLPNAGLLSSSAIIIEPPTTDA